MGKITGFLEIERHDRAYEKTETRLKSFTEFVQPLSPKALNDQDKERNKGKDDRRSVRACRGRGRRDGGAGAVLEYD